MSLKEEQAAILIQILTQLSETNNCLREINLSKQQILNYFSRYILEYRGYFSQKMDGTQIKSILLNYLLLQTKQLGSLKNVLTDILQNLEITRQRIKIQQGDQSEEIQILCTPKKEQIQSPIQVKKAPLRRHCLDYQANFKLRSSSSYNLSILQKAPKTNSQFTKNPTSKQ